MKIHARGDTDLLTEKPTVYLRIEREDLPGASINFALTTNDALRLLDAVAEALGELGFDVVPQPAGRTR